MKRQLKTFRYLSPTSPANEPKTHSFLQLPWPHFPCSGETCGRRLPCWNNPTITEGLSNSSGVDGAIVTHGGGEEWMRWGRIRELSPVGLVGGWVMVDLRREATNEGWRVAFLFEQRGSTRSAWREQSPASESRELCFRRTVLSLLEQNLNKS